MTQVGDVLAGRYRIEGLLGAGGMATVHRATDLRLGRQVAIKVLLPNLAQQEVVRARFDREARALAAIEHPAVVAIHDVEPGDPAVGREPFFVMELCDGGSLAERLSGAGRLSPNEIVPLASRIAEGLAALHALGIVHRDVKPHNVLLSDGGPKLGDFGIARFESSVDLDSLTATGTTPATIGYAAPEILAGEKATPQSDVYGLAAVVYEALTGRRPRTARSLAEVIDNRDLAPDPPSTVVPGLGTPFDGVVLSALAPNPDERPDLRTMVSELESAVQGWARDRPPASAATQALSTPRAPDSDPDPNEPTIIVPAERAPLSWQEALRGIAAELKQRRPSLVTPIAIAVVAAAAILFLSLAPGLLDTPGPSPGGAANASPATATSTPTPTASASPVAQDQGDRVRSSIDALQALVDDLPADTSRDLGDRVDEIDRSLAEDDIDTASEKARDLAKRIRELVRNDKLDRERADQLQDAVAAVLRALGEEPTDDD